MKAIQIISHDLFDKVRSRFQNLEMGDEAGAVTIDPKEARFFDFDFVHEGVNLGRVSISLGDLGSLKIYYSQGITENQEDIAKKMWYDFLKEMRLFAMRRLLRFDTRDIAKTNLDKNDFQQLAATQGPKDENMNMNESRWNHKSTKKTSRAVKGTTEVIVRHTESMEEMAPGLRSHPKKIKAIYIQNKDGERFKYPFIHTAGAFAMAQHVDHGGVPHDPAGKAIMRMSEQIAQLQEFQKHVKRSTLHDDAMGIVEKAVGRLGELKAQIESLSKRHHYESWISEFTEEPLMADLDPVTLETYKQAFTQTSFNENLANLFPLIHSIMQEKINIEEYVKEGFSSNLDMQLHQLTKSNDIQSAIYDALGNNDELGRYLQDKMYDVARDNRLHPDDDNEEIIYIMSQHIEDEYGDPDVDPQEPQNEFTQFEQWAEAVESGDLTQDQKDALKSELESLASTGQVLELGNAYQFFSQFGIEDEELEQAFELEQQRPDDMKADALTVFQTWAKEQGKDDLLNYLGMNQPAAEPVPAEPVPAEPAAAPTEPQAAAPAEQPVAEGKDPKAVIHEVAKIVKSFYNRDNPNVGPFRGEEGIAIDIEKKISEKFGEDAGQQARQLAEKFMAKLTQEWNERHGRTDMPVNQDDGLARLKELLGNVKAKVEAIDPKNPRDYEKPAYMRKQDGQEPLTMKDIDDKHNASPTTSVGLAKRAAELGIGEEPDEGNAFGAAANAADKGEKFSVGGKEFVKTEDDDALEAMSRHAKGYEKYGKKGMDALRQAAQNGAGEEKMDQIRNKHDRYDEEVNMIRKLAGMAK